MEESGDGDGSPSEDLLGPGNRRNILGIMDAVRSFPKRDGVECLMCQEDMKVRNLHDAFKAYGAAMSCLVYHAESVEAVDIPVFFETESFILEIIQRRELREVSEVLEYHRSTKDMYEDALRDQLVGLFREHFQERSMKINCEQDIESMAYRYYKAMSKEMREGLSTRDLELILVLLFRRCESTRFFRIFGNHRKTRASFRLALLMSTNPECHVSTEMLLKESREFVFEDDSLFEDVGNEVDGLEDVREVVGDLGTDTAEWIEGLQREAQWEDCVKVWADNRKHNMGAVDNSMMELCIRNKRFEEGWMIYEKEPSREDMNMGKVCSLCFSGLKETCDRRWIDRIIEVVSRTASGNAESSCIVADTVLARISEVPEDTRGQILRRFVSMVQRADSSEEVVDSLLRGFLLLCNKCKDMETCELCAEYAGQVYEKWKKLRKTGFLFFKRRGQRDTQIYSNMLGVCDAVRDCEGFYNVCRDLMKTDAELNRELCTKLEKFHNQTCKDCNLRKTQIATNKSGKVLIFHFLNKS